MADQFQDLPAKSPAGGIDSYSSREKIGEDYVEDALNMDSDASGRWTTRRGYENYFGWLPLRVRRFVQTGTTIKLYFDTSQSIDLAETGQGPLILYGKLPSYSNYGTSSFSDENNGVYFATYQLESRETLSGSGTTTRAATDTGISSKYVFAGLSQATSPSDTSNTTLETETITIDTLTFDVSVGYTVPVSEDVYFLFKTKDPEAGSVYIGDVASLSANITITNVAGNLTANATGHGLSNGDVVRLYTTGSFPGNTVGLTNYYVVGAAANTFQLALTLAGTPILYSSAGSGTISFRRQGETFSIGALTHNLASFRIGVRVFDEATTTSTEIVPTSLSISLIGTVEFTIEGDMDGYAILTTVPLENSITAAAVAGMNSITLVNPPSPYCFYYAYAFDSGLNKFVAVTPASIHYDSPTDIVTIEYELAANSENVEIYYEEAITISNILSVEDTGSATIDVNNPSLTVWGIGHQDIYRADAIRGGWANHIDNYKSVGEEKLVAGVGGCLYYAGESSTASALFKIDGQYGMLRARTGSERFVAPLFSTTANLRTRGTVYDSTIEDGYAVVTDVTFVSEGIVDVTLSFENKTGDISLSSTLGNSDLLRVVGLGDDRNNGTFPILSIETDTTTSAVIRVANSAASDATLNEVGALGGAGVFTDIVEFLDDHKFVTNDELSSEGFVSVLTVVGVVSSTEVLVDVETLVALPDRILLFGTRESRIIPTRDATQVETVVNYVRGDSLETPYVDNKPIIVNVNPDDDEDATVVVVDGIATVGFAVPHALNINGRVFLYGDTTNNVNGEQLVLSTPTVSSLTFATTAADGTYSATALGHTIELDESIEWYDSSSVSALSVVGRWLPIEAPDRGDSAVIKDTAFQYFDDNAYSNQPNISSVVIADTMLFTNADDEVMKYDGVSGYEAGLRRNIPSVFMALDTSVPSILKGFEVAYSASSAAGKYFQIEVDAFNVGERIHDSVSGTVFIVVEKQTVPGTTDKWNIVVSGDTSSFSGAGTLTKVKRFRYYMRFNMIDRNNNSIASAAVNSSDMYFDIVEDGRILIKTSYYPITGYSDYERIELEVYKTISDTSAPFYLAKRIALDFDFTSPTTIEIIDDSDDEFLTQLDAVNSALLGAEIGTGWQPPYRAGVITTFDNSTIIGDLKSWPRFDITFKPKSGSIVASDLNGFKQLFRKNSSDPLSTPNFEDRVGYQFKSTGSLTITGFTGDTFTSVAAPIVTGDWVYLFYSTDVSNKDLACCGWFEVEKLTANTFKLLGFGFTSATAVYPDKVVVGSDKYIPVWIGADYNYGQVGGNSGGSIELIAARRLADAINFTFTYNRYLVKQNYPSFDPWLTAYAGADYNIGQVVVETQLQLDAIPEVLLGTISSGLSIFINNLRRSSDEQVGASILLYPSRVGISYKNYPEIFDNLDGTKETSDSVVDINPADGQRVTGAIPFFGDATFGAAQLNQIVVIFKSNSIYVLDKATREYQKLDSRGIGCTAPKTITASKDCIMFVNSSGPYRITRDMKVEYVGRYMEGKWKALVEKNALDTASATHWGEERRYKVSLPLKGSIDNSQVFVYQYDREETGLAGSWTRYDNHNSVLWANQRENNYYSSTNGCVFQVRKYDDSIDFRDDSAPISTSLTFRAEDFGVPGVRKNVVAVTVQLDTSSSSVTDVGVYTAVNLKRNFESVGNLTILEDENVTVRCTPNIKKGTHMQVKLEHVALDEKLAVSGLNFKVARNDSAGIAQAATYKS